MLTEEKTALVSDKDLEWSDVISILSADDQRISALKTRRMKDIPHFEQLEIIFLRHIYFCFLGILGKIEIGCHVFAVLEVIRHGRRAGKKIVWNMSGQRWNGFDDSCRNKSFVVPVSNCVIETEMSTVHFAK